MKGTLFETCMQIFDRTPFLQKNTKYAELAMALSRRRSTKSENNAMPEEKRAKENQSVDDPLHQLIEDDGTLRALRFLTAFFSFAEEREREERASHVLSSLFPSFVVCRIFFLLLFKTLNPFY